MKETMKRKNETIQVRLKASGIRVREWAELTGQSESTIADFFCQAGIVAVELAKMPDSKKHLESLCEAQKLRMQAKALTSRASKLIRDSKPATEQATR